MENTTNEGQTQVYTDGGVNPQSGVQTDAPFLNQPRKQLLDIINVLFQQSGRMSDGDKGNKIDHSASMTDEQVLAILVGMGIPQQMAMSGISMYRESNKEQSDIYTENNNQKNHNKMNFTLTDLYENVMDSINGLKAMDNDNSRVSYSVKESLTILEEAINAFPMKLKNADLALISEEIEKSTNPNLKFKIARNLYTKLAQSTWLNPISELREYIMESYNNAKWEFRISESIERTEYQKGNLMESFNSDLVSLLNEGKLPSWVQSGPYTTLSDVFRDGGGYDTNGKELTMADVNKNYKPALKYLGVRSIADMLLVATTNDDEKFDPKDKKADKLGSNGDYGGPATGMWPSPYTAAYKGMLGDVKVVVLSDERGEGRYAFAAGDSKGNVNESNIKSKFAAIAAKHPWSMDAKAIVNEMNTEDQKVASTANGKVVKILSPVLESENGLTFQLHGKNYTYDGKTITEATVTDPRFFDVSEGLKMFTRNGDTLSLHGDNGKTLEYNITEGTLTMGKINLSNVSIIELKESLLATNFSGYRNQWQNDKICKFFESVDLVCELDDFTTIQNQEFADVFLTMIGVQEGIYINKVNPGMKLNEMIKIDTATETVNIVKEFINFDISPILSERLLAENNEKAIDENKRKDLTDSLSFLEEKKSEVQAAIKKLGETEELTEALNLLEEELKGKEKELANSYISEKKTKDQYLNDGFVEASVKKSGQGLKVRQEVLVNAEEYASLGDDDMLSVIVPKDGKNIVMPKGDLEVKI